MLTIPKSGMAVAWLICSAVMARAQTPTIVSAIVNSATQQIAITGTSLTATGAPVVKLDSITLTLVSSSSTQVVAKLPAGLAAGTYRMTVSNGSGTPGVFDVTNGAVGESLQRYQDFPPSSTPEQRILPARIPRPCFFI